MNAFICIHLGRAAFFDDKCRFSVCTSFLFRNDVLSSGLTRAAKPSSNSSLSSVSLLVNDEAFVLLLPGN